MNEFNSLSGISMFFRLGIRADISLAHIESQPLSSLRHVGVRIATEIASGVFVVAGIVEAVVQAAGGLAVWGASHLPINDQWERRCLLCLNGRIEGTKEAVLSALVNFLLLFTNPWDDQRETWASNAFISPLCEFFNPRFLPAKRTTQSTERT